MEHQLNCTVEELQHRITVLEQSNAELVTKNMCYEEIMRQLEQDVAQLAEGDVLHELIDDISHDLRLPLSTITNYLYLLKHDARSEKSGQYFDVLERQVAYLTDVVNNLIHMVRLDLNITHFDLQRSHINQIMNDVVEALQPVAQQKNQVISMEIEPDLPTVLIDWVKVKRALMNVVQNAVNYTPPAGKIHVRSATDSMGYVIVEVADNGIGIAPEDLPRIFDRFYRVNRTPTQAGNSGLGLAITKRIIENHWGRIEVESELNKGTLFRIYLPTLAVLSTLSSK